MAEARGPLAGMRVLDAASFVAGPLASALLGDLGAEVVKVEPPEGDPLRRIGGVLGDGMSATFAFVNRGKRSVVVDPQSRGDLESLALLVGTTDIAIHNKRPRAAARLGIEEAPVVVEISAFGREGPYADRPALDPIVQAMAGIVAITGESDGEPMRAGAPVVDVATALTAAFGALAGLRSWGSTREAQRVTVSLFEVGLLLNAPAFAMRSARGEPLERLGNASHALLANQLATADGLIWLALWEDAQWQQLCGVLRSRELAEDERFASNALRVANQERIWARLAGAVAEWRGEALRDALEGVGIPAAVTLSLEEVASDPHVVAIEALRTEGRLAEAKLLVPAGPLRLGGERPQVAGPAPALGEHTDEIFNGIGKRGGLTGL